MPTTTDRPWISAGWQQAAGHVLFWGGVLVFFVLYFGRAAQSYRQSLLFVALLLPVAMATTYTLTHWLVPRYLLPGRYVRFALYTAYTFVASAYLELVVLVGSFVFLAGYEVGAMNPATLDVFGLVVGLYVVVFLAMAANLAVRWHRLRAAHAEAEQARLEAELELRDAELARLKMQMHPHFLFNTLNNLYGLTLEGSEAAPDVVLRIADLLDYMLYRCDQPLVPLAGEIDHLRTYLELERLRHDERIQVHFCADEALPAEACVAPLLLVPLVENSFKHGARRTAGAAWIRIGLHAAEGRLRFTVENSKPVAGPPGSGPPQKQSAPLGRREASGIGLENVRQRLSLLYPSAHTFEVRDEATQFSVRLCLPLQDCEALPTNMQMPPARGGRHDPMPDR